MFDKTRLLTQPQNLQADTMTGVYKAIVVDNRDPYGLGKVRFWCYGIHGDFLTIPIEALPWAEPIVPINGAFTPPAMWSRVWITFECGDIYVPVYLGFWYGVPAGKGSLPYNKSTGTEVRTENWHFHDLSPETLMLGSSGDGTSVWIADKYTGNTSGNGDKGTLASSINLVDTGDKSISISSYTLNTTNYTNDLNFKSDQTIQQAKRLDPPFVTRTGVETIDPVAGGITLSHTHLSRSLLASGTVTTADVMTQNKKSATVGANTVGIEDQSFAGEIYTRRQDGCLQSMANECMMLASPTSVFINPLHIVPRRYDQTT